MNRRDFSKKAAMALTSVPLAASLMSFDNSDKKKFKSLKKGYQFRDLKNYNEANFMSNPVFVITKDGETEVLAFLTNFNVKTGDIRKTTSGHTQMDMSIENWEGECFSKLLNKKIGFKVTKTYSDSSLTSTHLNRDFPSSMNLKIKYDLLLDGEIARKGLMGRVYSKLEDGLQFNKNHSMLVEGGEITMKDFKFNFCAA